MADPFDDFVTASHDAGALAAQTRRRDALRDIEATERAEALEQHCDPVPGDAIRLTEAALRSMYTSGPDLVCQAPERRFTMAACPCAGCSSGRLVATREGRHIARSAVELVLRRFGPVDRRDRDAVLEQVGMRVDESGRWWIGRPGA